MPNNHPKRYAIYWFDPEPVKGSEIRKVRPCVIVSPDEMNAHLKTVIIVPLTSTIQDWPFRFTFSLLGHKSSVACDQILCIDRSRLRAYVGDLKIADRDKLSRILQAVFAE